MGSHLTEKGLFKSDKYPWCPEGFFALKRTDWRARVVVAIYAELAWDPRYSWCPEGFIVLDLAKQEHRNAACFYTTIKIGASIHTGAEPLEPELVRDLLIAIRKR